MELMTFLNAYKLYSVVTEKADVLISKVTTSKSCLSVATKETKAAEIGRQVYDNDLYYR